jgi:hypothetical protein
MNKDQLKKYVGKKVTLVCEEFEYDRGARTGIFRLSVKYPDSELSILDSTEEEYYKRRTLNLIPIDKIISVSVQDEMPEM